MSNLLPLQNQKEIKKEYLMRLVLVGLVFLAVSILFNTALLLPSYFLSNSKIKLIQEKTTFLEDYLKRKEALGEVSILPPTNEKIKVLELFQVTKVSDSIKLILSPKSGSIKIESFIFKQAADGAESILIAGISDNREALISFSESLRSISDFESVNLPLSNLARSKDIDFSLEIKIKNQIKPNYNESL